MTVETQSLKIMKNVFSLVSIIDRHETNAGEADSFLFRGFGGISGLIYEINDIYRQVTQISEHILHGFIFCHFNFAFIENVHCCIHTR
jgi:hypothetical protein